MRLVAAGCAALALSSLAPLAPAAAQRPTRPDHLLASIANGARVRILARLDVSRVIGTFMRARGDTMVVDTTDTRAERRLFFPTSIVVDEYRTVAVPVAAVQRIEVSTGRDRLGGAVRSARRLALMTSVIGGLYGISRPGSMRLDPIVKGVAAGAAVGVTLGAPYGFTRGAERWRPVALPAPDHLTAAGGGSALPAQNAMPTDTRAVGMVNDTSSSAGSSPR